MSEASGIPAWAVKGARVVCINDTRSDCFDPFPLRKGAVYEVIGIGDHVDRNGRWGIKLVGAPNRVLIGGKITDIDCGWYPGRFRPAVPPKTQSEDVGLFRHHLDDVRADA